MKSNILVMLLLWVASLVYPFPQDKNPELFPDYSVEVNKIILLQNKIQGVHPFLKHFYPVAVAQAGYYHIYEYDGEKENCYSFKKRTKATFTIPKGLKAAFPINGVFTCVVTPEIFNTKEGYVFIFHEFIHCRQATVCEQRLKENLKIYQSARAAKNWSWELNHKFPYQKPEFTEIYGSLLKALEVGKSINIKKYRLALKKMLNIADYEYMVWQEWKEGFARYIENKIRIMLGLPRNDYAGTPPYNRVVFYRGGELLIHYLVAKNPRLNLDIERLFYIMQTVRFSQSPRSAVRDRFGNCVQNY